MMPHGTDPNSGPSRATYNPLALYPSKLLTALGATGSGAKKNKVGLEKQGPGSKQAGPTALRLLAANSQVSWKPRQEPIDKGPRGKTPQDFPGTAPRRRSCPKGLVVFLPNSAEGSRRRDRNPGCLHGLNKDCLGI